MKRSELKNLIKEAVREQLNEVVWDPNVELKKVKRSLGDIKFEWNTKNDTLIIYVGAKDLETAKKLLKTANVKPTVSVVSSKNIK